MDDGITGTTMKRPGFQKMIAAIEAGYISAVFVKDLSRLGRNYIEVGKLTEEFFPLHDVRLVAVSDGVDSDEGEDDFTPVSYTHLLFFGIGYYQNYLQPYSSIYLTINPEVQMDLNRQGTVVGLTGANEDVYKRQIPTRLRRAIPTCYFTAFI